MKTVSKIEEFKKGKKYAIYTFSGLKTNFCTLFEATGEIINEDGDLYVRGKILKSWNKNTENTIENLLFYEYGSLEYSLAVWKEIEPEDTDELIENYKLTITPFLEPNTSKNNHRLNT